MAKRNVGREIGLILGAAVLLGVGFWQYLEHTIERPTPIELTASRSPAATEADQSADQAREVATQWARALSHRDYETARSLMAPSFRERVSADALRDLVTQDANLSGIEDVAIFRTTEQRAAAGSNTTLTTLSGTGMLKSRAGTMEIKLHFVHEGKDLKVLTVLLAGVPALTLSP